MPRLTRSGAIRGGLLERDAFGRNRHREERSDAAIQSRRSGPSSPGLLRFARNDELGSTRSHHALVVCQFCAAALVLIAALAVGSALPAFAQDKEVDLRLSLWVPPAHPLTSAAKAWGEDIAKASGGTIKITVFPSEQLGKAFDHYDMARDDIADITYVNPSATHARAPRRSIPGIANMRRRR